jgi:hypothetical protein
MMGWTKTVGVISAPRRVAPRALACLLSAAWLISGCGDNLAQSDEQPLDADTRSQADTADTATSSGADTATADTATADDAPDGGLREGCLQASPLEVGFFVINPGEVAQKQVRLNNCGDVPVTLAGVSQTGGEGEVSILEADQLVGQVIAPGEGVALTIVYAERDDGLDRATFTIDTASPPLSVTIEVPIWSWSDTCAPSMVTSTDASFGAIAVTEDDFLYVVSSGSPWIMAEVSLRERTLTPVIQGGGGSALLNWIELVGDEVSAFELYPLSARHIFNRRTREVSQADGPSPEVTPPYPYDGALFSLYIGQSEGADGCKNVCIVRDNQANAAPIELIDDGDEDFSIHTGAVYFLEGYAYFMSFQSVFNTPGDPALRRLDLRSGEVEEVFRFAGQRVNAWVYAPVKAEDGAVYWLRYEQETLDSPWLAYIDRHDIATNRTDAGFISGLSRDARALGVHSGHFVWTDSVGVKVTEVAQGASPRTLATITPASSDPVSASYAAQGARIFYSLSAATEGGRASKIGCATLAP